MWTPKRILLLVGGFFFFFGCFQVYRFFLGRYDGLPPLPAEYRPRGDQEPLAPVALASDNSYLADVKEAFGEKCEEVNRRVFHWRQQGLLIATEQWQLLPNGRLHFSKVSVALFQTGKADGLVREINTLRGDEAEIEFDKPIKNLNEIGQRKPVSGELRGAVLLKNNRKTAPADDDVRLQTDWLKYRDDQRRIWTDAPVRIIDDGCGAVVAAVGMEVELAPAEPAAAAPPSSAPAAAGAKKDGKGKQASSARTSLAVGGVRRVRLDHDVRMELPDDGRSNFLASGPKPAAPPLPGPVPSAPAVAQGPVKPLAKAPAKGLVVIESLGPFVYRAEQERAEFTDKVKVIRKEELAKGEPAAAPRFDQLDCEQLVLQFVRTRKPAPAGAQPGVNAQSGAGAQPGANAQPGAGAALPAPTKTGGDAAAGKAIDPRQPPSDLAIATAVASGKVVELTSDGDAQVKNLHAIGAEMRYDKQKGQTTLRGGPLLFVELSGYEMRLEGDLVLVHDPSGEKPLQEARAMGPGEIRILPAADAPVPAGGAAAKGEAKAPIFVRWKKQLTWGPDDGKDRLLFTGPCSFEDPLRGKLEANEQLAIWVETLPAPPAALPPANAAPVANASPPGGAAGKKAPADRKQPSRLVATGDVSLHSRELLIRRTDRLSLAFVPEPADARDAAALAAGPVPPPPGASPPPRTGSPLTAPPEEPARAPLEFVANWIDARLQKSGARYDLERMRAEGAVHVVRPPATAADKPVDIRADRLELTRLAENLHKADLFGKPAVLQLEKLFLSGPEIKFDQQQNYVEVTGAGTMRMPTKSDFDGRALAQETDLTIEWGTRMFFDGLAAQFVGAVKAEQQQARLRAGKLTVELDRKYPLTKRPAGAAKEQPVALVRLVGDDGVILERRGEKVGEYQRVQGRQLDFNNPAKVLEVNGPGGQFDLLSARSEEFGVSRPGAAPAPPKAAPAPAAAGPGAVAPELKLTRIYFEDKMLAKQLDGVVSFSRDVQLFYVPTDDVNVVLKPDKLPPDSLYIQCRELTARAAKPGGTGAQELRDFVASGRVRVEAREFDAMADLLTYDAPKEMLTMEGLGGKLVTLRRYGAKGAKGDTVQSQKLIYDRRTGNFQNLGIQGIQIGPQGSAPPPPAPQPSRPRK